MADMKYADRVAESTVTPGTGDINLAGAIDSDHATFGSQFADGDLMPVSVFGGGKWMTFTGRYNSGANSLTRMTFRRSSTGSNLSLSGTMTVLCGWGADDSAAVVRVDGTQAFNTTQQNQAQKNVGIPAIMRSYIDGLTISTAGSSSTFAVAVGVAIDSTNIDTMVLASSLSKTTSAWAVGSGNGGLDAGSIATNTWYAVHMIKRVDTGVVDVLISTSTNAPTIPTNYTLSRRIGFLRTNVSGQWIAFSQVGDEFILAAPFQETIGAGIPTSATLLSVTLPAASGIYGKFRLAINNTTGAANGVLVQSPDETSVVAGATNVMYSILTSGSFGSSDITVRMNTSAQFRWSASISGINGYLNTIGWIDRRSRDN